MDLGDMYDAAPFETSNRIANRIETSPLYIAFWNELPRITSMMIRTVGLYIARF